MIRLGPIARNEACRQLTAAAGSAFTAGATFPQQIIQIFENPAGGTGPKPDILPAGQAPGVAGDPAFDDGATLLATLAWNAGTVGTPFVACGLAGALPGQPARTGTAYANTIDPDTEVDATGTAQYFRILNRNANSAERFVLDGEITVVGGGGDIEFDDVSFVAGGTVIITDLAITIPITCPQDQAPL